ncbi:MAG: DUF2459 domain-containing protein [Brevundimonas sp.]|uniref:DUF2459 domain-containing protein n=1 Tax=Brevundimonas sp. TaxID=1871086 RepID=UPI002488549D|nr:DUF2459 domain-containing protein [Brevundimonas sp.]MDI1327066.1 DUF2459 domain-containing protein [Brevundimonas sp.]
MRRRRQSWGLKRFLAVAILATIAAVWTWTAPGDPGLWPARAGEPGVEVHLLDNGFHTDLAVPRRALEARPGPLADAVRGLAPGEWILIGWGDAKFYVDQSPMESRLPDGLRAFFRPGNASVIMLDPAQRDPRAAFAPGTRRTLRLSRPGFDAMADHIQDSLDLAGGGPRISAARAGDDARFFASREHFSIARLCNHWSAGVLNAAGLPVRPIRSITSAEVMATIDRAQLDTGPSRD